MILKINDEKTSTLKKFFKMFTESLMRKQTTLQQEIFELPQNVN